MWDTLPAPLTGAGLDWTGDVPAGQAVTFTVPAMVDVEANYEATITNTSWFSATFDSGGASATVTLKADTVPPGPPQLSTPANGSLLTTRRPTFRWQAAEDSESGVISYTLAITGSHDEFSLQAVGQAITTTGLVYIPTADLPDGTYTWTVRAHDVVDNVSDWVEPPFTFTLEAAEGSDKVYLPLILNSY